MNTTHQHLTQLESTGLLRLTQTQPELEYLFRHALIQDAAYESLLLADRKRLHLKIGETIEQTYPDQVASGELAPVLAEHFAKAGDEQRTLKYFSLAGDLSSQAYANNEAVMHYTRALEVAPGAQAPPEQLRHLYIRRGRVLELTGQFEQALSNYTDMEKLAKHLADQSMELAALMARATVHSLIAAVHDPAQVQALSEQALVLAHQLNDQQAEVKILWNLTLLSSWTGHMREAVEYGEQGLALARQLDLPEQLAYLLNDISLSYFAIGRTEKAQEVLAEARALWQMLDNQPMLLDNLTRSTIVFHFGGDYPQALHLSEETLRLSQGISHAWGLAEGYANMAFVHLEYADFERAREAAEQALIWAEQAGNVAILIAGYITLASINEMLGAVEYGLEQAQQAVAVAEKSFPIWQPWATATLARLHLLNGDFAQADTLVKQASQGLGPDNFLIFTPVMLSDGQVGLAVGDSKRALTRAEEIINYLTASRIDHQYADALFLQAQIFIVLGQTEQAYKVLSQARAKAESIGSRKIMWRILSAMAEVETQLGHPISAADLRRQAVNTIDYIANHAPPELRDSFLNLPDVQAVMGA